MESVLALQQLDTDLASGLTEDEARRRLERYGYNELAKKEQRISPLTIFTDQFKSILIAVLLVAAVLSAAISEWIGAVLMWEEAERRRLTIAPAIPITNLFLESSKPDCMIPCRSNPSKCGGYCAAVGCLNYVR
jgi:magnesium-transporting ATPase (P-type)